MIYVHCEKIVVATMLQDVHVVPKQSHQEIQF